MCSYKNGSRTREKVRDRCAGGKWEEFTTLLDQTEPGNAGNIGKVHSTCTSDRAQLFLSVVYMFEDPLPFT